MKYVALLILLSGLAMAQRPGPRVTRGGDGGCRMEPGELKPLIDARNPFFVNHHWDDDSKTEVVQMAPSRFLTLSQEACLRHHIKLELAINREAANAFDANFYPREVFNMMNRVFFNDVEYYTWKLEFEEELLKAFARAGVKENFSFHVNNLNFQCFFNGGEWGATIEVEIIRLIMRENIRTPGIDAYLDDGNKK